MRYKYFIWNYFLSCETKNQNSYSNQVHLENNGLCCVLCGSPEPYLREHTWGLRVYFPSILGHAPENRVGTLKA